MFPGTTNVFYVNILIFSNFHVLYIIFHVFAKLILIDRIIHIDARAHTHTLPHTTKVTHKIWNVTRKNVN